MATKLYFHRATTAVSGTLPAAGTSVSGTTPTKIASGGDTNRIIDTTISAVAQTTNVLTVNAQTAAQTGLILRCVSPLIAAQTIAAQTVTFSDAGFDSNTNSNFATSVVIVVWRPGTGAKVGAILDDPIGGILNAHNTTSQTAVAQAASSSSVTAQDGDVIIAEIWRLSQTQAKATAYTNTIAYDGTTEASTTNEASFISFPNTITFFTAAATSLIYSGTRRNMAALIVREPVACFMNALNPAWRRRRSGLLVPRYA
jgi:hypothetical protein